MLKFYLNIFLLSIFGVLVFIDVHYYIFMPILIALFFVNFPKLNYDNLLLFSIYTSFFGIYLSLENFPEIQIYRLLILPIGFYILLKGLLKKQKIYLYFLMIFLYIWIHPFLVSWKGSLENLTFTMTLLSTYFVILVTYEICKRGQINKLLTSFLLFIVCNIIVSVSEVITSEHLIYSNIVNYTQTNLFLPTGFFFNQNDLGITLLCCLIVINIMDNKIKYNVLLNFSITILIFIISSRTLIVCTVAFYLILFFKNFKFRNIFKVIFIGIPFVLVILMIGTNYYDTIGSYSVEKLSNIINIFDSRNEVYAYHIKLIYEYPFGLTENMYNNLVFNKGMTNSHSLVIELTQRFGLIFIFALIATLILFFIKNVKGNKLYIGTILIIFFLMSNVSSSLLTGSNIVWSLTVLAILMIVDESRLKSKYATQECNY
ncbi:O-antigen polymerase [Halobacillus litoralis]|uniref:O-antigen ligase domain-containing protein n=1 Tax=Halobacillus litoralis TaxID=45668 RepID=A0A410MFK4_9BACI|nr:O-antigen polymerase [Halobacillus litoralis]QAS53445.1 hypothetical protein HLI_15180 [Halobacillus litoralis]